MHVWNANHTSRAAEFQYHTYLKKMPTLDPWKERATSDNIKGVQKLWV